MKIYISLPEKTSDDRQQNSEESISPQVNLSLQYNTLNEAEGYTHKESMACVYSAKDLADSNVRAKDQKIQSSSHTEVN